MKEYIPQGVCSRKIIFDVIDGKVIGVSFEGGCNGNLKGIGSLIEGMDVTEAVAKLNGIRCGMKNTSCPDQLSKALSKYINM